MGILDRILGRRKPARRRARRGGLLSAPDGQPDRRTVLISRREDPSPQPVAEAGADPWADSSSDRTELKQPRGPDAGASQPLRPPPARSRPRAHEAEETIVGSPTAASTDVVGVLVGVDGPLKNRLFRIFEGETVLGRTDATENLDDRHISRGRHTVVRHVAGYFSVEPVSEKGTYLNGRRIEATEPLSDRDRIRLGSEGATTFLFRSVE